MHLTKHGQSWFITDMPDGEPDCGPYATKAEAESDRIGMARFLRHENKPGFVTCEAGSQSASFVRATKDLEALSEIKMTRERVQRWTNRVGNERTVEVEASSKSYQSLP